MTEMATEVVAEVRGRVGCITLNRPKALNALSLGMVRDLMATLLAWQHDDKVLAVAIRGNGREGPFGAFCAGGDIRFLHAAGSVGNPQLEDFFTEEYALNHLIHNYGKPYIAFMDGIVMGGGMGISQGGSLRIVTERTKMAMPETAIGLFPDVGGGYFLSRCPGRVGEWLALTGDTIGAADAIAFGLADGFLPADQQAAVWEGLGTQAFADGAAAQQWVASKFVAAGACQISARTQIDQYFALDGVSAIVAALERANDDWARATAATLRKRSPLMLHVVLEQIRRARAMGLADDLRMERDMVRHCFYLRPGESETLEGIRALAVDKDQNPAWRPARIEDVSPELVQAFFKSPWPAHAHPLAALR
ncbi:enoyl-CoA hydratase/isomerase family protein [Alicycliphilus denitrificans]|uniref:3-hydroxyisobutyryl-CoA hydrolase n=2 Tax=Alicycliphilus denitrificans TaxID=179636 RepID=F4G9L6_ALIDK|nr:enoyl-CoA hydratase/isomerase family protein [Alicycliphilus denitrificans]ADU99688.1 Enoyl-CoA hydratase/isomerase [Alicycliphilus denitrificans BC]AEB84516.1 3-hydroxyisobutyryl-CoA hydrolase [Alicycliphilus denitrificans K601]QKD44493.1 enoyl-CoA hydratase/isomerase family protein [Alicycliphilus denitrificans]GAO23656.1 3-hydroxyisobutyryl-CoA hydrolase [Alicycliphilus sp. B1]